MYKIGGWIKGRTIRRQLLPDLANFCAYPSFVEEHTLGKIGKNHRLSIYTRYSSVKDFRARYAVCMQEMQPFRILVVFRGTVVHCMGDKYLREPYTRRSKDRHRMATFSLTWPDEGQLRHAAYVYACRFARRWRPRKFLLGWTVDLSRMETGFVSLVQCTTFLFLNFAWRRFCA